MSDIQAQIQDGSGNNILPKTITAAITDLPDFASQIKAVSDTANGKIDIGDALKMNGAHIDGSVDWNTISEEGVHRIDTSGNSAGVHFPGTNNQASTNGNWGFMIQMGDPTASNSLCIQVAFMVPGDIWCRAHDGGAGWEVWQHFNSTQSA